MVNYKEEFQNLIKVLDKEIEAYEKLAELFNEKKEILKKAKSDELGVVDNKILALRDTIVKIQDNRKNIANTLLGKEGCMSEFIELSKETEPSFTKSLSDRKVTICNTIERLTLLNNQNVELIKHGIIMTDKMLETIVDVFAPQGSNYNEEGKTTNTHDLDMWTINKEI